MKDDSDSVARFGKLAEQLEDFRLKPDVKGRSEFVEKHDLGLLCQELCDEHQLPLLAGQSRDGTVGECGDTNAVEGVGDDVVVRGV